VKEQTENAAKEDEQMPRTSRMIIDGEKAVYHVMSRTALDGFPLKDVEKDFMLDLIKNFSLLYLAVLKRGKRRSSMIKLLRKSVKRNLKSVGSIDSDIVRAILRIQASSGQWSLWLKIINDLNIYFARNEKKNQSRSKVWMGCIH